MSHRVPILSVSQNRVLYGQNLERNVVLLFYNSVNPIPFTCHRLKNGAERDADDALLLSIGPIADSDLAELRLLRRPLWQRLLRQNPHRCPAESGPDADEAGNARQAQDATLETGHRNRAHQREDQSGHAAFRHPGIDGVRQSSGRRPHDALRRIRANSFGQQR